MTPKEFARKVFARAVADPAGRPVLPCGVRPGGRRVLAARRAGAGDRRGVAAALRLALTDDRAGLLVVRSKGIDLFTTATVSAAVLYIAWTIDPLGTS